MINKKQELGRLGLFLLITFSLTWIPHFICLGVLGYEEWLSGPFGAVLTLTMFAPMLGNIFTRLITKEGWGDSKLHFNFKGNIRYYITAFLVPVLWWCIAVVIVNLTHGNWRFESLAGHSFTELFTLFFSAFIMPVFYYSTFCFGEEFGWRAYMDQKLESLFGTAGAVIFGGILWGAWHGVLVAKGYNFGSGHPVLSVALMCLSCIFINAFAFWLTKRTDSVFPAVLLHTAMDMQMDIFFLEHFTGGLSEEAVDKVTELQMGLLLMVIPQVIVGTVFFILLMRRKKAPL